MGARGPAPKPTALRRLHGETRPSRLNDAEPVPALSEVVPPYELSEDARSVWDRLAPDLIKKGVLSHWDVDLFGDFCNQVALNRGAAREIDAHGATLTVLDRVLADGSMTYRVSRNPALTVLRESSQRMASLSGRFGLTPADRAQLHVDPSTTPAGNDLLSNPARYLTGDPARLLS